MAHFLPIGTPVTPAISRRKKRLTLTPRDRELLRFLAEYGCITAPQIKQRFWNDNPKSRAHFRRIGILRRAGWIEIVYGDLGVSLGYRLSKRGRLRFQREISSSLPVVRRAYRTSLDHDLQMSEIEGIFTQSPLVREYRSEGEARRALCLKNREAVVWEKHPPVPDAMFVIEIPGVSRQRIALELELTQKSRGRYARIFRCHLLSREWDICLYVVKGERLYERLREISRSVKRNDLEVSLAKKVCGIYFCLLDEVLSSGLSASFTNGTEKFSLDEVARNFGLG